MENNLYFIANQGCDATTYGLVMLSDEDFPKFKQFIIDLNKNSYYDCMPTISVYKISMSDLKEIDYHPRLDFWDEGFVSRDDVFYLNGKTYTFAKKHFSYYELECVIEKEAEKLEAEDYNRLLGSVITQELLGEKKG